MRNKKIYSAFISSVYESLRDERSLVIETLLDNSVFPICMEHFTVSASGNFSDIESRIDEADFFILLLGSKYGSQDENGVSWTEREYRYAVKSHKQILAIICDELDEILKRDPETLSPSEKKQVEFCNGITFARTISPNLPVAKIIGQFLAQCDYTKCAGWVRGVPEVISDAILEEWQNEHKAFDLSGTWYHVHLSADDENYIRVGTIQITQSFDPANYDKLHFDGYNYSITGFDKEKGRINENKLKSTHWKGDYTIDAHGVMFGIFMSKREFKGVFNDQTVDRGIRRGIHDFKIETDVNERVDEFRGEFHDEAPSPKAGNIYVFRTEEARLAFILQNCEHIIDIA